MQLFDIAAQFGRVEATKADDMQAQARTAAGNKAVVVVTDTAVFIGATIPVRSISLSTSIGLFNDKLRINGLLDYRSGFVSHNVNGLFQCAFRQNCAALHVKGYDLLEQAKAVAGPRAFGAYGEQADFLRLREFSMHPAQLLPIKQQVLRTNIPDVEAIAKKILRTDDPDKRQALLEKLNS